MFGKNKTLTPHTFDQQPADTLLVTAIFPTLQGEGPYTGRPAVFMRLTYCNLSCPWCDSFFDAGSTMTFGEIDAAVRAATEAFPMAAEEPPLLVITGGEPLMQQNLGRFLRQTTLPRFAQIESNGNFYQPLPLWAPIVVSPKINETTKQYVKVNPDTLRNALALKFVVSSEMAGYQDVPEWALQWRRETRRQIYLSPMNMYRLQPAMPSPNASAAERVARERISFWQPGLLDMETNRRNHEHAAELAMRYSCILSLQQHIYASLP